MRFQLYILAILFSVFSFSCQQKSTDASSSEPSVDSAAIRKREARIRKDIKADIKAGLIEEVMKKKQAQGFNGTVLVAQKGIIVYQNAYGYANFKDTVRNTLQSKFQLASLSKTFTAVAVMKLSEQGKLGLDNTVKDYYPDFPYEGVTIRSLLCHRSGLPYYQYTFDKVVRGDKIYPTNQEMMKWFATTKPTPAIFNLPDHFFSYNNTNFAILAALVEKVTGMGFDQYMRQNIFVPLGMKDSFIATSKNDSLNINRTYGYQFGQRLPKDYYDDITGDKGVFSTAGDLLKWYNALRDNRIISKESLKEMILPRSFEYPGLRNYGYGFRLWVNAKQQTDYVYHTGWWKGYNTIMFFDLREDFVIILLSNRYNRSVYNIKEIVDIMNEGKKSTVEENILDE
ncbi:serine hydrolase [Emticicia sp. 21SJ11W-3]|uniref:serine hydrolase domain-containing protein n=1 Tax=Emticicia sp. 21SJ11W-3 TaxID=2916755 RepID=UPI00209ED2C8|nr:serine hydrolase domain-containing protein [Emticicia sp. 21SJ11W-3]UTA67476.1 beta-lactamase family protein [Emticicia sp. 21SJ11W-3]